VFPAIIDATFNTFGLSAVHVNKETLVQTSIIVIKKFRTENFSFGNDNLSASKMSFDIKADSSLQISRQDRIILSGTTYEIIGEPKKDSQGLTLSVDLDVYYA
jgi:hypothetical protein